MNKKRLSIIAAIFLLVPAITSIHELSAETWVLSPPTKVSLNETNNYFRDLYDVFCLALSIYKSDALERCSKEALIKEYGSASVNSQARFDLEHIDIGKKGWTRHYPVSIGDKHFIIRIFLTEEYRYQPKVATLFEVNFNNPAVTLQVLPGINAILNDCKIKPHTLYPVSQAATSP